MTGVQTCALPIYGEDESGLRAETLEQLRALENGVRIKVVAAERAPPGIDTREDYEAFVRRRRERKS